MRPLEDATLLRWSPYRNGIFSTGSSFRRKETGRALRLQADSEASLLRRDPLADLAGHSKRSPVAFSVLLIGASYMLENEPRGEEASDYSGVTGSCYTLIGLILAYGFYDSFLKKS